MSKNLLIVIALLVLLGGGWWVLNKSNTPETTMPTEDTMMKEDDAMMEEDESTMMNEDKDAMMKEDDAMMGEDAMAKNTVKYTENGFEPATITVAVGDTVTWVNETDSPMWVSSVADATHEALTDFDGLEGVMNGETYSYTFTEAGSWNYNNHSSETDAGVVVVE